MKVICAGLLKTGTKSMASALRILGYGNVHDHFEQFTYDYDIWKRIYENKAGINEIRQYFEHIDAVMESPACAFWEQLFEAFPDAKVVLMVRNSEDEWFESIQRECLQDFVQVPPRKYPRFKWFWKLVIGPTYWKHNSFLNKYHTLALGQRMSQGVMSKTITTYRYRQHNEYVKLRCPEKQLLIYNVADGWEPLCEFLEKPIPNVPFPRVNMKNELMDLMVASKYEHDCGMSRKMKNEILCRVLFILFLFVIFILILFIFLV